MASVNKTVLFLPFQSVYLFFYCFIALVRTLGMNGSGKRVHPCLVPDLVGRAPVSHH